MGQYPGWLRMREGSDCRLGWEQAHEDLESIKADSSTEPTSQHLLTPDPSPQHCRGLGAILPLSFTLPKSHHSNYTPNRTPFPISTLSRSVLLRPPLLKQASQLPKWPPGVKNIQAIALIWRLMRTYPDWPQDTGSHLSSPCSLRRGPPALSTPHQHLPSPPPLLFNWNATRYQLKCSVLLAEQPSPSQDLVV